MPGSSAPHSNECDGLTQSCFESRPGPGEEDFALPPLQKSQRVISERHS